MTDIDSWTQHMTAAGLSLETVYLRRRHVTRVLSQIGVAPDQLTSEQLTEWLAVQEWSAATRRSYRASLRNFYGWFESTGRGKNVADSLPAARVPRAVPSPASDEVILAALRSAPPRVQLMIELMAYGGLRRGEVARVKATDLHGEWLQVTGKGGHIRMVPLPPAVCTTIRSWPHRAYLFPGASAPHLTPAYVGKLVRSHLPAGVTSHKLRHRFATTVYRASHDIRAVQQLLGHAKLDTTMIYTAVTNEDQAAAASMAWRLAA